ncbi:MAG TPA: cytochrome P450 [Acidimicrobiales bacterium]|nr:cytochrome P450 [Acidimicrobiales bacterium]
MTNDLDVATTTATDGELYYDPFSRAMNCSPHAIFKRIRDEAPLYHNDKMGFYALSRFDDLQAIRLDVGTYTSTQGVLFERMLDRDQPQSMLIEMDPPQHPMFRRVTSRHFSPRAIGLLQDTIRSLCCEFLDAQVGKAEFDFVEELAKKLPMMVTSSLLGLDRADQDELRPMFDIRESSINREDYDMQEVVAVENRIRTRLLEVAEQRRADPRDDLISVLVQAEIDDPETGPRPLSEAELAAYCLILYTGGNSTTTLLLSWMAVLLARHPDQRQLLLERPELVPNAIEEILRFEPVSHTQGRTTTRDVEWYGQTVPAGSKILMLTGAALRDERRYDRPDEFDITREIGNNTAFGFGNHVCIGAHLARLEGRIALEEMLKRFPDWDVRETLADMRITSSMRGYYALPMTVGN